MVTQRNDGPAFPLPVPDDRDCGPRFDSGYGGMSMRDYFAARAMQGWLSSYGPGDKHPASCGACEFTANQAYAMADAMIAARGADMSTQHTPAPDLLSALIEIRAYLSKCPPHAEDITGAKWGRVMDLSGAALNKAEGKS